MEACSKRRACEITLTDAVGRPLDISESKFGHVGPYAGGHFGASHTGSKTCYSIVFFVMEFKALASLTAIVNERDTSTSVLFGAPLMLLHQIYLRSQLLR